jgi:hypothetical protein
MAAATLTPLRRQGGQAIVLLAFITMTLCGCMGLGIDASLAYFTGVKVERAASAAAMSGVIFMPSQFTPAQAQPAGSGNDATDRVIAQAQSNGFTSGGLNNVTVTPAQVPGAPNKLQVTVCTDVATAFMRIFGVNSVTVCRSQTASYLRPITLGQSGSQVGASVSQLGTGNMKYFMRTEGWGVDRGEGDPYTPNPNGSTDVHAISFAAGGEPTDPTLPDRGGYNYRITLRQGGIIQVYNAAFAPDSSPHNYCDNFLLGSLLQACNSNGSSYYYHEEDGVNFSDPTTYGAMRYTVFQVPNPFLRSDDVKLTQMTVRPIDARNFNVAGGTYKNVNSGNTITQTYDLTGYPTNMLVYHNWIDVTRYAGTGDDNLVSYQLGPYGGTYLPAGVYRLRVDDIDYNGVLSPGSSTNKTHKGYAVRALDQFGNACPTDCTVSAWFDMATYTPVAGGTYNMQLFQLPPEYAGKTITVDVWDIGDISGSGTVTISILDPTGAVAPAISITNIGYQRSPPLSNVVLGSGPNASWAATDGGGYHSDNVWTRLLIPVPGNYSPNAIDPSTWWWQLQYQTAPGTTAIDTVGYVVYYPGNPTRLGG